MRKTAQKIKHLMVEKRPFVLPDESYHLATLKYAPDMAEVIWEVKRAFAKGIEPTRSTHGTSQTYFLNDCEGVPIAVFKRFNFYRELAAYRLDYDHFAGVPQTVLTTLEHPFWGKATGSCQLYVPHSITAVELEKNQFRHFLPSMVRRIASLDIRTMNEDRHTSNLLVVDEKKPIPIDHGFILPRRLDRGDFVWLEWQQAATPFSEFELSYISLLDPEEDRRILIDELYFEERRANRLFIATVLLKLGALRGLTPLEIGKLLNKKEHNDLSPFEFIIEKLRKKNPPNWSLFSPCVYDEVKKTLDTTYEPIPLWAKSAF